MWKQEQAEAVRISNTPITNRYTGMRGSTRQSLHFNSARSLYEKGNKKQTKNRQNE